MHPQFKRQRNPSNRQREAPMSLAQLSKLPAIQTFSPSYFTEADHPWLRALLNERERFAGQKRREWKIRISEPWPGGAPQWKVNVALRVLDQLSGDASARLVPPRRIRALVFRQASMESDRAKALAQAAVLLDMSTQAVLDALFADLPDERMLLPLSRSQGPVELALACNAAMVSSMLAKALRVRIVARGQVRAVVRQVRLMGLLCQATPGETKDEVALEVSGPYSLFRHTRIYGHALATLVPRLAWCSYYCLEADCVLRDGVSVGRLVLSSGDPIAPAREISAYDSKVEEQFAREFGRLALAWDIIREPYAIKAGDSLIFPDFELRQRTTGEQWSLEIIGYWTADYVRKKLFLMKAARIERLIVCIDEERCCTEDPLELDARVIRYRRKVDPRTVLEIVDPIALKGLPPPRRRRKSIAAGRVG